MKGIMAQKNEKKNGSSEKFKSGFIPRLHREVPIKPSRELMTYHNAMKKISEFNITEKIRVKDKMVLNYIDSEGVVKSIKCRMN